MKTSLYLLIVFLLSTTILYSQVKVNSNGSVGIRTLYPDANYDLHVKGTKMWFDQSWPGIFIDKETDGYSRIIPGSSGYCYVGTDNYRWYLVSTTHTHSTYPVVTGSDFRLKRNINPITNPLFKLTKLQGVSYNYAISSSNTTVESNKAYLGFIAQEVQKEFPELVVETQDSAKTLGIMYDCFIPLLVEALKEQQTTIETLRDEVNTLKADRNSSPMPNPGASENQTTKLEQNSPNRKYP